MNERTTTAGATATYTITTSALNGFGGDVSLSLAGLSTSQASWSFDPTAIAGGGSALLTISTSGSLQSGTYPLAITGTSATLSHSTSVSLIVRAPPDFVLSIAPATVTLRRGGQVSSVVTATAVNGFTSSVSLSVSGLPSGVTGSFSPNPIVPTGQSTLVLRAQRMARLGTVVITVKATGGGKTNTTTATLKVTL